MTSNDAPVRCVVRWALVVVVLVLGAPAAAGAQAPSYPGGNEPPPPKPTREVQTEQHGPRDEFVVESCGFQAASSASKSFNDEPSGSATADDDGCVHTDVKFVEPSNERAAAVVRTLVAGRPVARVVAAVATMAAPDDCEFDAIVDGQRHAGKPGRNTLAVLGTGSNGNAHEVVNQLVVQCVKDSSFSAAGTTAGSGGGSSAVGSLGRVAGDASTGGVLARTGGMIARWAAVGALFLAIGALLVVVERRRLARRVAD